MLSWMSSCLFIVESHHPPKKAKWIDLLKISACLLPKWLRRTNMIGNRSFNLFYVFIILCLELVHLILFLNKMLFYQSNSSFFLCKYKRNYIRGATNHQATLKILERLDADSLIFYIQIYTKKHQ